jgi:hypothetical protein
MYNNVLQNLENQISGLDADIHMHAETALKRDKAINGLTKLIQDKAKEVSHALIKFEFPLII